MNATRQKFCQNCGAPLSPEMRFCEQCGAPVEVTVQNPAQLHPAPPPLPPVQVVPPPVSPAPPESRKKRSPVLWIGLGLAAVMVCVVAVIFLAGPLLSKSTIQPPTAQPAIKPVGTKQFAAAPAMQIDKSKQYIATVKMAKGGEFVIQLFPDKSPIAVNNFVFLVRQGFYDGTTFHRVLEGFMAQGGDPTGTGRGGPGYQFKNEDNDLKFDKPGVVAMANAGRDTNGSQFFITFVPTPDLDGGYTIFGQVTSGMDVVNEITRRDPSQNPTFAGDVIQSITITEK